MKAINIAQRKQKERPRKTLLDGFPYMGKVEIFCTAPNWLVATTHVKQTRYLMV